MFSILFVENEMIDDSNVLLSTNNVGNKTTQRSSLRVFGSSSFNPLRELTRGMFNQLIYLYKFKIAQLLYYLSLI